MASKKDAKINLHNTLSKSSFNHAVLCTFTFDPVFFEEYCLVKFNSLSNNANITVITDKGTYEKVILGSEQYKPKQANIRYLLYPISVSGVFHPKIFLFAGKKKGRLIIGSANFTRPGITSNAEMVASYDYEDESNTDHQHIFQAVFQFLYNINRKWPSDTLSSNLQAISRDAPWLVSEINDPADSSVQFFNNLEAPLLDQIISEIDEPAKTVWILSRYFDQKPDILDEITLKCKPNKIKLFTQNGITTLTSDWLKHTCIKKGIAEIFLCEFKDGDHYQPLHAKAMIFEFNNSYMMCFGSANFTTPALLKKADRGNLETLLLINGIKKRDLNPRKFFDPTKSSEPLKEPDLLVSAPQEEDDFSGAKNELKIIEAILLENKLKVLVDIPEKYQKEELFLRLTFYNQAIKSQPLIHINNQEYTCEVSKEIIRRLEEASTIAQVVILRNQKTLTHSNSILVTNLIDIQTGKNVRRERHIREAQQSAVQFFRVLDDLVAGDDDDALITFLTYCDIPVINVERPGIFRGIKPVWGGGQGMRKIGVRNLIIFETLHDAAISFFDRHFKKLKRHVEYGGIEGISNFMHIWLSMAGILNSQIERALQGFESKSDPMSADEWYNYREYFDIYYHKFQELMNCLWNDYLTPLIKEYDRIEIQNRIEPDLQPFKELSAEMIEFRDRLEKLRISKLKVKRGKGKPIMPQYFSCILNDKQWTPFCANLELMATNVESSIHSTL